MSQTHAAKQPTVSVLIHVEVEAYLTEVKRGSTPAPRPMLNTSGLGHAPSDFLPRSSRNRAYAEAPPSPDRVKRAWCVAVVAAPRIVTSMLKRPEGLALSDRLASRVKAGSPQHLLQLGPWHFGRVPTSGYKCASGRADSGWIT